MSTHVPPPPHEKLEEVLSLTGRLEFYETELEQKERQYTENQQLRKKCRTRKEKRAWDDCQIILKVKMRALEGEISVVEKKLEKLPKLCPECRGRQLIPTGPMTDRICSSCRGDGLKNGPNQQARRKKDAEMLKKIQDQIQDRQKK